MTIKDTPRNARNVLVGWLHSSRLVAYEINSYRLDPSMTSLHSTIPESGRHGETATHSPFAAGVVRLKRTDGCFGPLCGAPPRFAGAFG